MQDRRFVRKTDAQKLASSISCSVVTRSGPPSPHSKSKPHQTCFCYDEKMKLQVGVKVLIRNKDGLYLLIQRSAPLPDGTGIKWDIPGGRIKPTESLKDALARELKEETGIELSNDVELLEAQDIIMPDLDLHVVRLTYVTTLEEDVTLGTEHQSFKWTTLQEALDLNVDPYLRKVLEAQRNSSKPVK
jgi:8-oxo-dGTP pyrophosphatase MutT (NUDIX family)